MTLQVDPAALAGAHRRVGALHEELVAEQVRLARRVDGLLDARWSGTAASQFRTAWREWSRAMRDLLTGIDLEGEALALARAELVDADDARAAAARRLQERLGAS